MQTMHWYNPVTKEEEDVPAPMNDEQAIGMLSGHPDSDRFIEEYRRRASVISSLLLSSVIVRDSWIRSTLASWEASRRARSPEGIGPRTLPAFHCARTADRSVITHFLSSSFAMSRRSISATSCAAFSG